MKDRSTESDAATALERALLDAARSDHIPADLKARMAAGLIAPPPATAASAAQPQLAGLPRRLGGLLFSKTSLWGTLVVALIGLSASLYGPARHATRATRAGGAGEQTASMERPIPVSGAQLAADGRREPAPAVTSLGTREDASPIGAGGMSEHPGDAAAAPTLSASRPAATTARRRSPSEPARDAHERASGRTARTAAAPALATRASAQSVVRASGGDSQLPDRPVEETTALTTELEAERSDSGSRDSGTTALRAELSLLDRARAALRTGDSAQAQRLLDQHAAHFGRGALAPEADALAIETLLRSGARERAAERAERFLQRHAGHPLAAQIERWRDAALR